MFCGFEETVRILRLFCQGSVVEWDDNADDRRKGGFGEWIGRMGLERNVVEGWGVRAVVVLRVWKVGFLFSFF